MALASTVSRWTYTGNNSVSVFDYTARIVAASDLVVTVRNISSGAETPLVITTDYTVTGVGNEAGGSITLVAGALSSAYKLVIRRVRPITQATRIRNQTEYYAETHENQFDIFIMVDQQQQDALDRSVALPETLISSDFDPTLPSDIVGKASALPILNDAGDGWALAADWPTVNDIYQAASDADDSAEAAAESAAEAAASALAAAASAAEAEAAGALKVVNNLSDLGNKPTALVNLNIAPLSYQISHAITSGQSATNLIGETFNGTAYTGVAYEFLITQGTTVGAWGSFVFIYINGTWTKFEGESLGTAHGLTFTSSQATTIGQLKVAESGSGDGTLLLKRHYFFA